MPIIFLSPSTQEYNAYVNDLGSEEEWMNHLADAMEPILFASGIQYTRNDRDQTAAAAIRALNRPDAAAVPIIAVTANVFAEDIDRTTKAGMNDHISKPINSAVLRRTMQKLIAAWDAARGKTSNTK